MPEIEDQDANIHLSKQATTTTDPVIIPNNTTARIPYGSNMDFSHIATLHLPGLSKQASQIQILPK